MNIAICEYFEQDRNFISDIIQKYCSEQLWNCQIDKYFSFEKLQAGFAHNAYHMIFMDMCASGDAGMKCAGTIRELDPEVIMIFITDMEACFEEGFKLGVKTYLLKPLEESSVRSAIRRSSRNIAELNQNLEVNTGNSPVKVLIQDIQYIENTDRFSVIHTRDLLVKTAATLEELEKKLTGKKFIRTHQSYLVNLNAVSKLNEATFQIKNGDIVPICSTEVHKILEKFSEYKLRDIVG